MDGGREGGREGERIQEGEMREEGEMCKRCIKKSVELHLAIIIID